jgi:hypothetical protein
MRGSIVHAPTKEQMFHETNNTLHRIERLLEPTTDTVNAVMALSALSWLAGWYEGATKEKPPEFVQQAIDRLLHREDSAE